ncbi:MAG: Crp/Fnr family transcriptional regulator [Aureispira sp.]
MKDLKISYLNFESDRILSALPPKDKAYFLSFAQRLLFKKSKLIFYERGTPTGLFLVKEGRAKIYKTGIYGKDQIFYIYKKGDLFGYHALLANERYEDSCEALEDCEILFFSKRDVEHLLEKIQKLKLLFLQNMSHEFGVLVNTITILAQKPLRQRLALYLLILHERYFDEKSQKAVINLSREDLANIIGTARESLGRLLKDFKEEGLIKINKRTIEIVDFERMEKLAES